MIYCVSRDTPSNLRFVRQPAVCKACSRAPRITSHKAGFDSVRPSAIAIPFWGSLCLLLTPISTIVVRGDRHRRISSRGKQQILSNSKTPVRQEQETRDAPPARLALHQASFRADITCTSVLTKRHDVVTGLVAAVQFRQATGLRDTLTFGRDIATQICVAPGSAIRVINLQHLSWLTTACRTRSLVRSRGS